jgi:hypothetical protein
MEAQDPAGQYARFPRRSSTQEFKREETMSVQKKSLISNRTAAKKAILATKGPDLSKGGRQVMLAKGPAALAKGPAALAKGPAALAKGPAMITTKTFAKSFK